ncbi:hypothetical protein Tco_1264869 [Tanacetum coccineum]
MSIRPVRRKKLNYCNTSNEVDVNLSTPMPKPQSPLKEPSQENPLTTHLNHDSLKSHSLPLGDSCDTNVGQALIPPQSANQTQLTQPSFSHLLTNPHVASVLHTQTPPSPQGDNQTQPPLPSSPSVTTKVGDDPHMLQENNTPVWLATKGYHGDWKRTRKPDKAPAWAKKPESSSAATTNKEKRRLNEWKSRTEICKLL